jgi:dolichyl-phosphate beta-glucosyltransferase
MPDRVHLVIPCFFESGRIGAFLDELCVRSAQEGGISILVVDDGSGAEEQQRMHALVEPLMKQHPHLRAPLMLPKNRGKGGAVHAGWNEHQGQEWLGFVDADGACSATETVRLIKLARIQDRPKHALVASRVRMLGHRVQRYWHREVISRIHATLVYTILRIPVHDSQCGLKLVPRSVYEHLAPHLKVDDFGFDIELIASLVDSGCAVEEVPVDWHEVSGGKLRLFRDAWKMFCDILSVRQRRTTAEWQNLTRFDRGHESGALRD